LSGFDFLRIYIDGLSDERKGDYKYALKSGKDESEIRQLETDAGIAVPGDLVAFYNFSYGADLGCYKILTISEIVTLVAELREINAGYWRDSILPFAYVIDVGDSVAFDLEQSDKDGLLILDCFHELLPTEWKGICFGLKNWLVQMVENDFEPFWL
jgi:hypothetical protein